MQRVGAVGLCAALASFCAASQADAADVWHTSTVKQIYPRGNGQVVLTFTSDSPSCTNASTPKYYYITVGSNGVTAEGARNIYAAAMLAGSLGKTLTILFSDDTTSCVITRAMVNLE